MYVIAPNFFKKVLCLSGFGWLVRGAVVNFFEHKTSVAVHYERRFDHTLPNIAFCRREAFAGGTTWTDMVWLWCVVVVVAAAAVFAACSVVAVALAVATVFHDRFSRCCRFMG